MEVVLDPCFLTGVFTCRLSRPSMRRVLDPCFFTGVFTIKQESILIVTNMYFEINISFAAH